MNSKVLLCPICEKKMTGTSLEKLNHMIACDPGLEGIHYEDELANCEADYESEM